MLGKAACSGLRSLGSKRVWCSAVTIGVTFWGGMYRGTMLVAALLTSSSFLHAAPATPEPKADAKSGAEASAKPALQPKPSNPFDDKVPKYAVTGELPNLLQLDFEQMGKLLYAHLLAEADPSRSALIIEAALQRAGKSCAQINAFQIYRYRTGSRTLKVKCPGKPLYVLTVGNTGGFQISGGDGTVPELQTSDGRIYSLFGREIKQPKAPGITPLSGSPPVQPMDTGSLPKVITPASPQPVVVAPAVPAGPATGEPGAQGETFRFRSWLLLINGVGLGMLMLALWGYLRARRKRSDILDYGLSSDDKDLLLDESREIYPNIFQHPQGFFISRGRRGKRRLFRSAFPAILYRDFGLKMGEIRI